MRKIETEQKIERLYILLDKTRLEKKALYLNFLLKEISEREYEEAIASLEFQEDRLLIAIVKTKELFRFSRN